MNITEMKNCPQCNLELAEEWLDFDKKIMACPSSECAFPLDQNNFKDYIKKLEKRVKALQYPELKQIRKRPADPTKIDPKDREKIFKRLDCVGFSSFKPEFKEVDFSKFNLKPMAEIEKLIRAKEKEKIKAIQKVEEKVDDTKNEDIFEQLNLEEFANIDAAELEQYCNMYSLEDETMFGYSNKIIKPKLTNELKKKVRFAEQADVKYFDASKPIQNSVQKPILNNLEGDVDSDENTKLDSLETPLNFEGDFGPLLNWNDQELMNSMGGLDKILGLDFGKVKLDLDNLNVDDMNFDFLT